MNIILLLLVVLTIYIISYSKETLLNTSCNSNVPVESISISTSIFNKTPKLENENCQQFANRTCESNSYFITNTKIDKFPIHLLPGNPPKTISAKCWENYFNCCKQSS